MFGDFPNPSIHLQVYILKLIKFQSRPFGRGTFNPQKQQKKISEWFLRWGSKKSSNFFCQPLKTFYLMIQFIHHIFIHATGNSSRYLLSQTVLYMKRNTGYFSTCVWPLISLTNVKRGLVAEDTRPSTICQIWTCPFNVDHSRLVIVWPPIREKYLCFIQRRQHLLKSK